MALFFFVSVLTLSFISGLPSILEATSTTILVGADRITEPKYLSLLKGKRIGLITNHTAINGSMISTIALLKSKAKPGTFNLTALFAPEHGLTGSSYADEAIQDTEDPEGIPIYSLHGKTNRPTKAMLNQIDVLVYDIQDIGSRSYTYISTLFYAMEECAKAHIPVIVLDRPNPINGVTIDGPMLDEKRRSFLGYVNVPYCHGLTVGELALFFNEEYKVGCDVTVVPMKGWERKMSFAHTGLAWIPTSPYVPEATTAYFYPTTGILGAFSLVNIGIGFTLPFKLVGAPWIDAKKFAEALNGQKFPGVHFEPFHYRPFYGKFAKENCQGVVIIITDPLRYKPITTAYLLMGILKSLYPEPFAEAVEMLKGRKEHLLKILGDEKAWNILSTEKNIVWKLRELHAKEHRAFAQKRKKYLLPSYEER